ncbi:MAG: undecaprenyl-diphosphate phosphatase [Elusimicrobiales bacterium]|nr:undecaprenyl-diphosphate phosphatase [Elusimicrobiales bacterium]
MEIFKAVVLGAVQGLGEFLPISSSAHLALAPKLFGWQYQGLDYDVMLHLGTLLALLLWFRQDWAQLLREGFSAPRSEKGRTLWFIAAATVPAGAAGLLLEKKAELAFRSPALIALMLMLFAAVLYFADSRAESENRAEMNLKNLLLIGLAQALALAPGVSRSGITLTAALLLGFARPQAARISFLLSAPVIGGAALMQLRHLHAADITAPFAAGFIAAFLSGLLAIRFFMGFVRTHSLRGFVCYRLALGALILACSFWP